MKTKIFYLLLLCLMVLGRGEVWAATETYNLVGNTDNSTINTASGTTSFGTSMGAFYATSSVQLTVGGGSNYWTLAADRITGRDNNCSITLQASKAGTLVVYLVKNDGGNKYLKISSGGSSIQVKSVLNNNVAASYDSGNAGYKINQATNTTCPIVVTIEVTAGASYSFDFTGSSFYHWSFTGFEFTEMAPDIVSMEVNINDMYYSIPNTTIGKYVGTSFSYDLTNTAGEGNTSNAATSLRIKMDLGANLDNSFKTTDYFSVTSSNSSVINVSSYAVGRVGDYANKVYYYVNVGGAGEAVLTFTYHGPNGDLTCNKQFTIFRIPMYWGNKDNPIYPFTWDFTRDWTGSQIQAAKNTTNWHTTGTESRLNGGTATGGTLVSWSGIDMITGLDANVNTYQENDKTYGSFCLDWTNKQIWMVGTLKIPNLYKGHKVTFTTKGTTTISPTVNDAVNVSGNTYTMKTDGTTSDDNYTSPTFFTVDGYLESIKVEKSGVTLSRSGTTNDQGYQWLRDGCSMNLSNSTSSGDLYVNIEVDNNLIDFSDIVVTCNNSNVTCSSVTSGGIGRAKFKITANSIGQSIITISYPGSKGISPASMTLRVNVIRSAEPKVWDFARSDYWTGTNSWDAPVPSGYADYAAFLTQENSKWANTSGTDYQVTTATDNIELKAYNDVIPATAGLYITTRSNGVHLNVGNYMSLETSNTSSIRIPSLVAGQHVVFKTVANGGKCGVMTTSSNLTLISGQPGLDGQEAYYTFHVNTDGDGVFTRTNNAANLQIKYIQIIGASESCNETRFVNGGNDVSNTQVDLVSGTATAPFTISTNSTGSIDYTITNLSGDLNITSNGSGGFNISGTGKAKIEATQEPDGNYQQANAVVYVSVKNLVTITLSPSTTSYTTMRGTDFNGTSEDNNLSTVTGTASPTRTVFYKSSDETIARVDSEGKVTNTGEGTVTITAYTHEDDTHLAAEASYTVTYSPNNTLTFSFHPNSGFLNLSTSTSGDGVRYIIPYLAYPSGTGAFSEITFTTSDPSIVTVEKLTNYGRSNNIAAKIKATNDASKVGQSAIITAEGVSGSLHYYTTYTVTITDVNECNFDWVNSNDIYMYEGDYAYVPAITGNANGNESLSKYETSVSHSGYYWSMLQDDTHVTGFDYYNWDYRLGEGEPNFTIIDESPEDDKHAYILVGSSSSTSRLFEHPTTLLIYARKEGTVRIHAEDSQNGASCPDITLHIMPKSTIYGENGELTNEQKTISYPYTWDFTTDFSTSELDANDFYWEKQDNGDFKNTIVFQNSDFCDDNHNNNNSGSERLFKAVLANHHTIPQFKGMGLALGNTYYDSKLEKITIKHFTAAGEPRLNINGGPQVFDLPRPYPGNAEPDAYRLYVKVKATGRERGVVQFLKNGYVTGGMNNDVVLEYNNAENKEEPQYHKHPFASTEAERTTEKIFYYDYLKYDKAYISFQDVDVYWIAFSTEEKEVYQPGSTSYPSSTYSYSKALDLGKSAEVNEGLTTYYASNYDATTNSVTMSSLSENVESGKGLLLKFSGKTTAENEPLSCYMIADPENKDVYVEPSNASTDYLVGTVSATTTPHRFDGGYTNFVLTNVYWKIHDNENSYIDGYDDNNIKVLDATVVEGDWKFVRTAGDIEVGPQKAYLKLPGRLLNLNTSEGSNASRTVLNIVFDDDAETTGITNEKQANTSISSDDGWYTLQGMKLTNPTKGGIYIYKGKKIAIK